MPKCEQHPKKYFPLFRTPEQRIAQLEAENAALREQLTAAQKDAERYRWRLFYTKENINDNVAVRFALESTDDAIDEAMEAKS